MSFIKTPKTRKNAGTKATKVTKKTTATPDFEKMYDDLFDKIHPIGPDVRALDRRIRKDDDDIEDLASVGVKTDRLVRDMGDVDIAGIRDGWKSLQSDVRAIRDILDDEDNPVEESKIKSAFRSANSDTRSLVDAIAEANNLLDGLEDSIAKAKHNAPNQVIDNGNASTTATAATAPDMATSLASIAASLGRMTLGDRLEDKYKKWVTDGRKFDTLKIGGHIVKPYFEETRTRGSRTTTKIYEAKTADDLADAIFGWVENNHIVSAPECSQLDFVKFVYEEELS